MKRLRIIVISAFLLKRSQIECFGLSHTTLVSQTFRERNKNQFKLNSLICSSSCVRDFFVRSLHSIRITYARSMYISHATTYYLPLHSTILYICWRTTVYTCDRPCVMCIIYAHTQAHRLYTNNFSSFFPEWKGNKNSVERNKQYLAPAAILLRRATCAFANID